MDLARIRNEFHTARQQFPSIELAQTSIGNPYVRIAVRTSTGGIYVASIYFSNAYPNENPKVIVDTPKIVSSSPHMYTNGSICYMLPSLWNPGKHNLLFVIARTSKWLNKYEVWKSTLRWPGAGIAHS